MVNGTETLSGNSEFRGFFPCLVSNEAVYRTGDETPSSHKPVNKVD